MLIDSNRISSDWEQWLKSKSKLLFNVTGVYDTLQNFKEKFSYDFSPKTAGADHGDKRQFYFTINNKRVKGVKQPTSVRRLSATDPNAAHEYTFTTTERNGIDIFGFEPLCFSNEYYDEKGNFRSDEERYSLNDQIERKCKTYLTPKGLQFLKNKKDDYSQMPLQTAQDDNEEDNPLDFYLHIARKRLPQNFILLQTYSGGVCASHYGEGVTIFYSTPLMKVNCIVIKNISNETITINRIKMIFTNSDSLRTRKEDTLMQKTYKSIATQVKIEPNTNVVIPAYIAFTPLNVIKPNDNIIKPNTKLESYFYGQVSYIDTVNINGFDFPIQQFDTKEVMIASYDGRTYEEWGSCPYAYSYSSNTGEYVLENHILYGLNSKAKEHYDTLLLRNPHYKMALSEIDPEDSYIDELFILSKNKNGETVRFSTRNELLKSRDNKYLHLSTNDKIYIEFETFSVQSDTNTYYLVSYGYYKPRKTSYKLKKPSHILSI